MISNVQNFNLILLTWIVVCLNMYQIYSSFANFKFELELRAHAFMIVEIE